MSRALSFIIFFAVMLTVLGSIHYYLYRRLVVLPSPPPPWSTILSYLLLLLTCLPPLSFMAVRVVEGPLGRGLVVMAMVWLGLMFILFVLTLAFDAARLTGWLAEKTGALAPLNLDRRVFLLRAGAVAVGGLGLAAGVWGIFRARLRLKTVVVEVTIPGLGKEFDGYTLVQMTDLHLGPARGRAWMEKVVATANALKPDLIAITGDLVDGSVQQLRDDVAPLTHLKAKDGALFVTGNHEYYFDAGAWIKHLTRLGIKVLVNERTTLKRGRASLDIAGVGDQTGLKLPPGGGTDVAAALKGKPPQRPCLLLAHQPRVAEQAHRHGVDLVLCGHTHGGQIWPFHYLVYLQQPYLKGLHHHKGTQVYVSQGTGTWGPPIRLGTEAELTKVVLRSA